jgi:dCMP deaminase
MSEQERYHDYMLRRMREENDMNSPVFEKGYPSFIAVNGGKWDRRFLDMAQMISTWSKDPSSKIGCVVVNNEKRIIATGYNGFPRGIEDSPDRLNDRDQKYPRIIHAEMNALMNALYNGVSVKDCTLYVYGLPVCPACTKCVIQAGIKRVVIPTSKTEKGEWEKVWREQSLPMFQESGVQVIDLGI